MLLAEGYWEPYGPDYPHMLFSLSKSFTSTAIGFLVAEGRLSVEDRVLDRDYNDKNTEAVRAQIAITPSSSLRIDLTADYSEDDAHLNVGQPQNSLTYLVGGGVVWLVRIAGSLAFGKEAMGLGDVHLMAGVGACLGWIDPTLAVFEPFFANRPTKDERTLEAMSPEVRTAYLNVRNNIDTASSPMFTAPMLKNAMAFEKAFVDAGGRLAAGVDPTGFGGALAGFGDQRNYELLIETGFTPAQTIQIMSANGAKILGVYDKLGSIERGKLADLVVLDGNLVSDPSVIRKVTTVFKDGVGYDSAKLIAAVKGRVGID